MFIQILTPATGALSQYRNILPKPMEFRRLAFIHRTLSTLHVYAYNTKYQRHKSEPRRLHTVAWRTGTHITTNWACLTFSNSTQKKIKMATKFGCLFIFVIILQLLPFSLCGNDSLQDKFTSRCDEICGIAKDTTLEVNIWFILCGGSACQRIRSIQRPVFEYLFLFFSHVYIVSGRRKGVPTRVSIF